jgi:hypothetical protein
MSPCWPNWYWPTPGIHQTPVEGRQIAFSTLPSPL